MRSSFMETHHKETLLWMVSLRLKKLCCCVPEVDLPNAIIVITIIITTIINIITIIIIIIISMIISAVIADKPSEKYGKEGNCSWCEPG